MSDETGRLCATPPQVPAPLSTSNAGPAEMPAAASAGVCDTPEMPAPARPARIPSSIFTQIFALVLATVAIAQLLNVLIFTLVPAEPPRTIPLGALAEAIETRNTDLLTFAATKYTPANIPNESPAIARIEADLAKRLGKNPQDVMVRLTDTQGRRFLQLYPRDGSDTPEPALIGHFQIYLLDSSGWQTIEPSEQGPFASRERQFLLLFLVCAAFMLPVAWVFARRLAGPIEKFADAAEQIGRDPKAMPSPINGPLEIERASEAVHQMQQRLQAYVADRTQMLGAIAHDLRTPLTRLAFRLENLDGPERDKLQADVAEMEAMIKSTLSLARSDSQGTPHIKLELSSLVEQVVDDLAETGQPVTADCDTPLVVEGSPIELRRLIANLLENAVIYGRTGRAHCWRNGQLAILDIEDEGPGLPDSEIERVFEPFYRLERSRSRVTGGTGLGLTVARSIARAHGGEVLMFNKSSGGLLARVSLPLAKA